MSIRRHFRIYVENVQEYANKKKWDKGLRIVVLKGYFLWDIGI